MTTFQTGLASQGLRFSIQSPSGFLACATVVAALLAGCSSGQGAEITTHVRLADGEVFEFSASGNARRLSSDLPSNSRRAAITTQGVVIERDGAVYVSMGEGYDSITTGMLLGSDRAGLRFATIDNKVLTIHGDGESGEIRVPCDVPIAGVWDGSDTIISILCVRVMFVVNPDTRQIFSKALPGEGIDITNWGEGFGVLVRAQEGLILYRTPCHEQDVFGVVHELGNESIVEVVGSVESEPWLALRADNALLTYSDNSFEKVADGVMFIGEAPGPELEFECQLGAVSSR